MVARAALSSPCHFNKGPAAGLFDTATSKKKSTLMWCVDSATRMGRKSLGWEDLGFVFHISDILSEFWVTEGSYFFSTVWWNIWNVFIFIFFWCWRGTNLTSWNISQNCFLSIPDQKTSVRTFVTDSDFLYPFLPELPLLSLEQCAASPPIFTSLNLCAAVGF